MPYDDDTLKRVLERFLPDLIAIVRDEVRQENPAVAFIAPDHSINVLRPNQFLQPSTQPLDAEDLAKLAEDLRKQVDMLVLVAQANTGAQAEVPQDPQQPAAPAVVAAESSISVSPSLTLDPDTLNPAPSSITSVTASSEASDATLPPSSNDDGGDGF